MTHDHGEFYHAPTFPFHPGDFLRDTADLSTLEVGAYWLLIMYAWDNYGIPNEGSRIANIAKLKPAQVKPIADALRRFWADHPLGCGCKVNPGLEKRREYCQKQAEKGAKGGRNPKQNGSQTPSKTEAEGQAKGKVPSSVVPDYDSLRSSALRFGEWPDGPDPLADLSRIFIDRFANCRDPEKVKGLLPPFTAFLASMRRRGVTIAQAWSACEDCWRAGGEKPLFGGTIRRAADFLPAFKPRLPEKGAVVPTIVNRQPDFVPQELSADERAASLAAGAETLEKLRGQFGDRSEAVA